MNKLSIAKLETARKNPKEFAKSLLKASDQSGFGYPKSLRWLNAICNWHEGHKEADAVKELEKAFSKRKDTPKNRAEVEDLVTALESYFKEFNRRGFHLVKSRERIQFEINKILQLSGQIPLLHMKPDRGFAAYFITDNSDQTWKEELRFPIVQRYLANDLLGCDAKDIDVGIVDYYTGEISETSFEPEYLESCFQELKSIGRKIASVLRGGQ